MDISDLSLYDPVVLSGVVEKMMTAEQLILLNRIPKRPYNSMSVLWDIKTGSRSRGEFNSVGAEANIVRRLGRAQGSAAGVAYREKKLFEPNTVEMIRDAGSLDVGNAEQEILYEVGELNTRADNLAEWCLWSMLSGSLTIDTAVVQASVDYQFLATHKPAPAVSWATASPQNIVSDIRAWQRLISKDGQVKAREVFATPETIEYIFDAFASVTLSSGTGVLGGVLLSDRMKDAYYTTGQIPGFMGMTWTPVETYWEEDNGTEHNFCSANALFMVNLTDGNPWELKQLPPFDRSAPRGHRGKYSKMWVEQDPSVEQHLLAWNFLPIITKPEQVVFVDDVTSTV